MYALYWYPPGLHCYPISSGLVIAIPRIHWCMYAPARARALIHREMDTGYPPPYGPHWEGVEAPGEGATHWMWGVRHHHTTSTAPNTPHVGCWVVHTAGDRVCIHLYTTPNTLHTTAYRVYTTPYTSAYTSTCSGIPLHAEVH